MTQQEILNTLLNCENLNAQQISHNLSIYGDGRMCQGIKKIFIDGITKGRIEGIVFSGCAALGAGIGYMIVEYKEKKELKQENERLKKIIEATKNIGEINE